MQRRHTSRRSSPIKLLSRRITTTTLGRRAIHGQYTIGRKFVLTGLGIEVTGLKTTLAKLCQRLRWVFHPIAIGLAAAISVFGIAIMAAQSAMGVHWPLEHQSGPTMLLLLAAVLATTAVHEFAHAAVIVRGGRTVDCFGAGLYWGALAFFTDSTDAYFLTKPWRLAQAAAGIFADSVLAAVAVLLSAALRGGA